jgi:hypothetical protein
MLQLPLRLAQIRKATAIKAETTLSSASSAQAAQNKKNIRELIKCLFLLLLMSPLLFFWTGLAWIEYRPLPPVPRDIPRYSLKPRGTAGTDYIAPFSLDIRKAGWRLDQDGSVRRLDEKALAAEAAEHKAKNARAAKRLKLDRRGGEAILVASNGDALVNWYHDVRLHHGGKTITARRMIRGYTWKPRLNFFAVNSRREVLGNGQIATAFASSGGMSNPHGRYLPFVWRGGKTEPEDLNALIDPASGWYLFLAIDINDRGQILCLARQTDLRGAEEFLDGENQLVVLTPLHKNILEVASSK